MWLQVYQLRLDDFLFYASREPGRLYETEKYLHNYGLTYALGLVKSPYANHSQEPHYQEDLQHLNAQDIYVTPATPLNYGFAFHTFKMASVPYYGLTAQTSTNQVLYGRAKELTPQSLFQFFVLSREHINLPRWIRLGKWMSKAQISLVAKGKASIRNGNYRASGALNPLDLAQRPLSCNIIPMAPVSIITHVTGSGEYYTLQNNLTAGNTSRQFVLPLGMTYQAR